MLFSVVLACFATLGAAQTAQPLPLNGKALSGQVFNRTVTCIHFNYLLSNKTNRKIYDTGSIAFNTYNYYEFQPSQSGNVILTTTVTGGSPYGVWTFVGSGYYPIDGYVIA